MYNTAVFMFKVLIGLTPRYVSDLLNRATVRYGSNNYVLPRIRIDLYKTSFAVSGPSVWNSLPPKMKTYKSVRGFKINLRKILMDKQYNAEVTFCIAMFIASSVSAYVIFVCLFFPSHNIDNECNDFVHTSSTVVVI